MRTRWGSQDRRSASCSADIERSRRDCRARCGAAAAAAASGRRSGRRPPGVAQRRRRLRSADQRLEGCNDGRAPHPRTSRPIPDAGGVTRPSRDHQSRHIGPSSPSSPGPPRGSFDGAFPTDEPPGESELAHAPPARSGSPERPVSTNCSARACVPSDLQIRVQRVPRPSRTSSFTRDGKSGKPSVSGS